LPRRLLEDVAAVLRSARLGIDRLEHVLEDRLLEGEQLSGAAIELPENPRLADREDHFLVADVDEHTLEHLVEIERLARRVLIMPGERAVLRMQRDGGA